MRKELRYIEVVVNELVWTKTFPEACYVVLLHLFRILCCICYLCSFRDYIKFERSYQYKTRVHKIASYLLPDEMAWVSLKIL